MTAKRPSDADLAKELATLRPLTSGTNKFDQLFPERDWPELRANVLTSGLSRKQIAAWLTSKLPAGESIGPGSVANWLDKQATDDGS